jgi:hypothetical protein
LLDCLYLPNRVCARYAWCAGLAGKIYVCASNRRDTHATCRAARQSNAFRPLIACVTAASARPGSGRRNSRWRPQRTVTLCHDRHHRSVSAVATAGDRVLPRLTADAARDLPRPVCVLGWRLSEAISLRGRTFSAFGSRQRVGGARRQRRPAPDQRRDHSGLRLRRRSRRSRTVRPARTVPVGGHEPVDAARASDVARSKGPAESVLWPHSQTEQRAIGGEGVATCPGCATVYGVVGHAGDTAMFCSAGRTPVPMCGRSPARHRPAGP